MELNAEQARDKDKGRNVAVYEFTAQKVPTNSSPLKKHLSRSRRRAIE